MHYNAFCLALRLLTIFKTKSVFFLMLNASFFQFFQNHDLIIRVYRVYTYAERGIRGGGEMKAKTHK
jgi:hypothetical protein